MADHEASAAAAADEERLRSAIGRKADHYLARWADMRARGTKRSWNWAACLAHLYWFAWRRMWAPFLLVALLFLALAIIGSTWPDLAMPTFLLSIAITFVTGTFGNHLYRRHVERQVGAVAPGLAREAALAELRRRGGTSWTGLLLTIGATFALIAWSVSVQLKAIQEQERSRAEAAAN